MRKYEAQGLLYTTLPSARFIHNISVGADVEVYLTQCRNKVREAIRLEFAAVKNAIRNRLRHSLLEGLDEDTKQQLAKLTPKFWGQGSTVYKTLNAPVKAPPQHIDLDDGVYLPMTIMSDLPVIKKQIFFQIVDVALQKLCTAEGWAFDNSKNTCCRVKVNKRIHIDVPLYAIPDARYQAISLAVAAQRQLYKADSGIPFEPVYLDENEVYLALRNREHWIKSDPMKIQKWFNGAIRSYGERLRRVCRYLKAWRDYTWQDGGGPSSIVLMLCAVNTFDNSNVFQKDCEAILAAAKALAGQLEQGIGLDGEEFYPRGKNRLEVVDDIQKARDFASTLIRALEHASSSIEVVAYFQRAFGNRMPDRPDWVTPLHAAAQVRSTRADIQPEPKDMSRNLKSGHTNYRSG